MSVGIRSLTVAVPARVRTNDELRERFAEMFAQPEDSMVGRMLAASESSPNMMRIDAALVPYLDDPFRGAVQRRVLGPEETSIDLEVRAGAEAIARAGLEVGDIDLSISVGFLPHDVGVGNAVFVAQRLGLKGGAWNLETGCAGPLTALQTAVALVRSGEYQNVLVTVSCTYTRHIGEDDTQSWFVGDGGGAFVVSKVDAGTGYLAGHTMHTADTLGTWYFALDVDDDGQPARVMRAHQNTAKIMRKTIEAHLRSCCDAVARKAGLKLQDIDYFVFQTPTAWFAEFAADALDIEPERTASVFPHYGNVGPALTPLGLHHAAASKRLRPGQTVLVYGPGSASSTAAVIMRWGEVALGQTPAGIDYGRRLEPV